MTKKIVTREFLFFTSVHQEALDKCELYWAQGETNVTVAVVREMLNPPETYHKYVVVRVTET